MKVRYRSYEELLYNIQVYHGHFLSDEDEEFLRLIAGTEVEIKLCTCGRRPPNNECSLPIFEEIHDDPTRGHHLCAHMAEID